MVAAPAHLHRFVIKLRHPSTRVLHMAPRQRRSRCPRRVWQRLQAVQVGPGVLLLLLLRLPQPGV
jgi:hypothetical protein